MFNFLFNKKRPFFFYYNKEESKNTGKPKLTLHIEGKTITLDNIQIKVPIKGHIRDSQPCFVLKGYASQYKIIDEIAYLYWLRKRCGRFSERKQLTAMSHAWNKRQKLFIIFVFWICTSQTNPQSYSPKKVTTIVTNFFFRFRIAI